MKSIIKKSEKEQREALIQERTTVKKYGAYYFSCETCGVAYFDDDEILKGSDGYIRDEKGHKIYSGDIQSFNRYYKII